MNLEAVAIVMLVFLGVLVSWAFLKGDSETHVKVLGMAFPMLGVVVGWLFQEGRIQDKEEQVVAAVVAEEAARAEAAQAQEAYVATNQQLDDVRQVLESRRPQNGGGITLDRANVQQLDALLEARIAVPERFSSPDARRNVVRPRLNQRELDRR